MAFFPTRLTAEARLVLALTALLLAVVTFTARPWEQGETAVRPDTGIAVGALAREDLEAVLTELLTRVYAAFGREEEGEIYDGLATAVSDDLLTDLYLQRRLAQVTAPPETAGTAEIQSVTLEEVELLGRVGPGYRIAGVWTVVGTLGHEDHRHERVNRYAAQMTLGPAGREWRLTDFDLDQVRREDVPLFLDPFE